MADRRRLEQVGRDLVEQRLEGVVVVLVDEDDVDVGVLRACARRRCRRSRRRGSATFLRLSGEWSHAAILAFWRLVVTRRATFTRVIWRYERSATRPASRRTISSMRSSPSVRCVISSTVWPLGRVEHVAHQPLGRLRVEVRGRLVEHQHGRAGEQRARQHEPLALAAGHARALLADERVEPGRERGDPVGQSARGRGRLAARRRSASGRASQQVRADRRVEEVRVLAGERERAAHVLLRGTRAGRGRRA